MWALADTRMLAAWANVKATDLFTVSAELRHGCHSGHRRESSVGTRKASARLSPSNQKVRQASRCETAAMRPVCRVQVLSWVTLVRRTMVVVVARGHGAVGEEDPWQVVQNAGTCRHGSIRCNG